MSPWRQQQGPLTTLKNNPCTPISLFQYTRNPLQSKCRQPQGGVARAARGARAAPQHDQRPTTPPASDLAGLLHVSIVNTQRHNDFQSCVFIAMLSIDSSVCCEACFYTMRRTHGMFFMRCGSETACSPHDDREVQQTGHHHPSTDIQQVNLIHYQDITLSQEQMRYRSQHEK